MTCNRSSKNILHSLKAVPFGTKPISSLNSSWVAIGIDTIGNDDIVEFLWG